MQTVPGLTEFYDCSDIHGEMKHLFLCLAFVFAAGGASAGDLSVTVNDASGKPVKDAVVTFTPDAGAAISAADRNGPFVMAQKNIMFAPFVLAVPVGATVSFPNQDRVNHHVYSFSPTQPFQLPLYGGGKTRSVTFTRAGTEALGCNIHDSMSAYIRVVATPYYATTDASGRVVIRGVPAGAGSLKVWQPMMDAPDHETGRAMTMPGANTAQAFSVKVHQMMPMGGAY